jgi:hypothetical protein
MDYITGKNYHLPHTLHEMQGSLFYNLWRNRLWPYRELLSGDTLYFYESPTRSIVWKTSVTDVERFEYGSKAKVDEFLSDWHENYSSGDDIGDPYFVQAAPRGICLAFKVSPVERMQAIKPHTMAFPQIGWQRADNNIAQTWLARAIAEDKGTLDATVSAGNLFERLEQLSDKLADVAPERIESLISHTIRRDTQMIQELKKAFDFRCQFPGCGVRIPKKAGGYYAEVAHIKAVSKGGHSVLGNLLVLCPNHHKSFDFGNLNIKEQSISGIRGALNGVDFSISCELD